MVVFDATTLMLLWRPDAPAPVNPESGKRLDHAKVRIEYLIKELEDKREKIIIPTPAISEILVRAGKSGADIVELINSTAVFRPAPFDMKAAVEVAAMTFGELNNKDRKKRSDKTIAKTKYDRQIFAIAVVENAHTIYSDDEDIERLCAKRGMSCVKTYELPLPPENKQQTMNFDVQSGGDGDGQ